MRGAAAAVLTGICRGDSFIKFARFIGGPGGVSFPSGWVHVRAGVGVDVVRWDGSFGYEILIIKARSAVDGAGGGRFW